MKKIYLFIFISLVLFSSCKIETSAEPVNEKNEKKIEALNNALIFNFYMNFELSKKNSNLPNMFDYMPNKNIQNVSSIEMESNMGNMEESANIKFDDKDKISQIVYTRDNTYFTYDFFYENNKLAYINITGNKNIIFSYNNDGAINSITRKLGQGYTYIYNFIYVDGKNKADIKIDVWKDDKFEGSQVLMDYVEWNSSQQITNFTMDVFHTEDIKYNTKGDIESMLLSTGGAEMPMFTWIYSSFDAKGTWTERKSKNGHFFKRKILYK